MRTSLEIHILILVSTDRYVSIRGTDIMPFVVHVILLKAIISSQYFSFSFGVLITLKREVALVEKNACMAKSWKSVIIATAYTLVWCTASLYTS